MIINMQHQTLADLRRTFRVVTRDGIGWLEANTQAPKVVVLLHGITGGKDDMLPLAKKYESRGYAVYSVDLLGHGDSDMPHIMTFADIGKWFHHVVTAIGREPNIIVTSSFASSVVYSYMQQGLLPAKTHVVLGCPTARVDRLSQFLDFASQVFPRRLAWYVYNTPPIRLYRIYHLYRGEDYSSKAWLIESEKRKYRYIDARVMRTLSDKLFRDNPYDLPPLPVDIQKRITVVIGERDNVVIAHGRAYARSILPHATFISGGAAGHIIHFEAIDAMLHQRKVV